MSTVRIRYSGYCRSDTIVKHPNMFSNWKDIGLDNLTIGFEAVDDGTLKQFNKNNFVEFNENAIKILNKLHINFSSYFLIDPDFERKDFQKISNYVSRLNLIRPRFVILTPLPATKLFEKKKNEINMSYDFFDFMHWVFPTKMTSKEFFQNFVQLYYKAFSFKRYLRILFHNIFNSLNIFKAQWNKIKYLSIVELVLLRIMARPLRKKLYEHYSK